MRNTRQNKRDPHLDPFRDLLRSVTVFLLSAHASRKKIADVMRRALLEAEAISRNRDSMATLYVALSKVLHAWHEDRRFLDANARPRPLKLRGTSDSVQLLARAARIRVPYTQLVRSLSEQGLIRRVSQGRYLPTKSVAKLVGDGPEVTGYVGQSILQLIQTLEANRHVNGKGHALLERAAIVNDLSPKEAAEFRRFSAEQGAAFISNANAWLESRRQRKKRARDKGGGVTAGVHVFAFVSKNNRS